jgi:hypothetical protein
MDSYFWAGLYVSASGTVTIKQLFFFLYFESFVRVTRFIIPLSFLLAEVASV